MAEEFITLVNRCLDGHQPSIGELVQRFRGQVYGLCYRMLGQREDAEDAMQESLLRVVRNLHRWDPTRPFEPWLLAITGNRCRTRLAKRTRRPRTMTLDYPLEDRSQEQARAELLGEEIDLALDHIRQEYKQVFVLFHKHQMAYNEIADSLNIPLGTVKTWVHRARRQMVERLKKRGVIGE